MVATWQKSVLSFYSNITLIIFFIKVIFVDFCAYFLFWQRVASILPCTLLSALNCLTTGILGVGLLFIRTPACCWWAFTRFSSQMSSWWHVVYKPVRTFWINRWFPLPSQLFPYTYIQSISYSYYKLLHFI